MCNLQLCREIPPRAPGSALPWSLHFLESFVAPWSQGSKGFEEAGLLPGVTPLWSGGSLTTARFGGQPAPWDGCQASTPPHRQAGLCSHRSQRGHPELSLGSLAQASFPHDPESMTPAGLCSFPCHPWWAGTGRGLLRKLPYLRPTSQWGWASWSQGERGLTVSGFCG